jgi:hypothetical protein
MSSAIDRFFEEPKGVDLSALATYLDVLAAATRRTVIGQLGKPHQALLFEAAQDVRPLGLDHFVPVATPLLTEVVHDGRNTMPVLPRFQKRLVRPAPGADELWGYNEHPLRPFIGPGYFMARESAGEVAIDYSRVPPTAVSGWPRLKTNSSGRGRLVYGAVEDIVRGVSEHVCIGRASNAGKPMDAWFVLTRA